jgi:hypothetical protein
MKGFVALAILLAVPNALGGDWGADWGRTYWGNDPGGAPDAPTITSVEAGIEELLVSFTPGSDGFSVITGYSVSCGSVVVNSTGSPVTVGGLKNDTPYTCSVTATNAFGTSSASAGSSPVAPEYTSQGLPTWLLYKANKRSEPVPQPPP